MILIGTSLYPGTCTMIHAAVSLATTHTTRTHRCSYSLFLCCACYVFVRSRIQVLPDEITLAKEPPLAPMHLTVLPLNAIAMAQPAIANWSLQPPLSVTLQHMCIQRGSSSHVVTVSTTQRFRSKYITIVIHKPELRANHVDPSGVWQLSSDRGWQPRLLPQQQPGRVSWSDVHRLPDHAKGLFPHDSENTGKRSEQQQVLPHVNIHDSCTEMNPAHITPFEQKPEAMDLGSRPASQVAFMDTGSHWQNPNAALLQD